MQKVKYLVKRDSTALSAQNMGMINTSQRVSFCDGCVLYFCCLQLSPQGQNHFERDQAAVSVKPIDSSFLVCSTFSAPSNRFIKHLYCLNTASSNDFSRSFGYAVFQKAHCFFCLFLFLCVCVLVFLVTHCSS